MNRLVPCLAALALTWTACADPMNSLPTLSGNAGQPSLAVHPDGHLWMTYTDQEADLPFVLRWSGARWESVGSAPRKTGTLTGYFDSEIGFNAEGGAFVAAREANSQNATLRAWDGKAWQELSRFSIDGILQRLALRVGASGQPVLAWATGTQVVVKVWTGTGFQSLDGVVESLPSESTQPWVSDVALTLDGTESAVVAHVQAGRIWIQRWAGTHWEVVGQPVQLDAPVLGTSGLALALDAQGRPSVAWYTGDGVSRTDGFAVRAWNGSAWDAVGSGVINGQPGSYVSPDGDSLQLDPQGRLVLSFIQNASVYLRRWDGQVWQPVGAPLSRDHSAFVTGQSTVIEADGTPVVAYSQFVGHTLITPGYNQIFVERVTAP